MNFHCSPIDFGEFFFMPRAPFANLWGLMGKWNAEKGGDER